MTEATARWLGPEMHNPVSPPSRSWSRGESDTNTENSVSCVLCPRQWAQESTWHQPYRAAEEGFPEEAPHSQELMGAAGRAVGKSWHTGLEVAKTRRSLGPGDGHPEVTQVVESMNCPSRRQGLGP